MTKRTETLDENFASLAAMTGEHMALDEQALIAVLISVGKLKVDSQCCRSAASARGGRKPPGGRGNPSGSWSRMGGRGRHSACDGSLCRDEAAPPAAGSGRGHPEPYRGCARTGSCDWRPDEGGQSPQPAIILCFTAAVAARYDWWRCSVKKVPPRFTVERKRRISPGSTDGVVPKNDSPASQASAPKSDQSLGPSEPCPISDASNLGHTSSLTIVSGEQYIALLRSAGYVVRAVERDKAIQIKVDRTESARDLSPDEDQAIEDWKRRNIDRWPSEVWVWLRLEKAENFDAAAYVAGHDAVGNTLSFSGGILRVYGKNAHIEPGGFAPHKHSDSKWKEKLQAELDRRNGSTAEKAE